MTTGEQGTITCGLVGADSLLVECGEILLAKGHTIAVVAAGSPRVVAWAETHQLPIVDASGPAEVWATELAAYQFQWLFSITHLALLPASVLAIPAEGAINFHDGPLPAYAGLNTPAWALLQGATTYGISWHLLNEGIDEGDVVKQRAFAVEPAETSLSLNTRNFEAALDSFGELIDEVAEGRLTPVPQDLTTERATFSRHDRPPAMAILDWSRPADELERMIRALDFGPYPNPLALAKVWTGTTAFLVTAAELVDEPASAPPGVILELGDGHITVACGEGALTIMGGADLRGHPLTITELSGVHTLQEGGGLPLLDDDTASALTEIDRVLARTERHHLNALERLDPLEVPWARTPPVGHVPRHASIPVIAPPEAGPVIGALAILLARLSGRDRIQVALTGAAAPIPATAEAFVAPFVPLEIIVRADHPLSGVAETVEGQVRSARERVGFAHELVARFPDLGRNPSLRAGELLPVEVRIDRPGAVHDGAVIELRREDEAWAIAYDRGLIDEPDARLLVACLDAVLAQMVAVPSARVADADLLGEERREEVLHRWNATAQALREDVCVHHLFEEQVDRSPAATAIVFEDHAVSYVALDARANQLAHRLVELGVGPDDLVGIYLPRGIDLLVAVLGVQKAGGAYVPLDPVYPAHRLDHMIRDSGCRVVISESSLLATLPGRDDPALTVVILDDGPSSLEGQPTTRLAVAMSPRNLAYCIYTSGSTGLPKGVLVEHRNVVNFFEGMDDRVPHDLPATWFAVTSLSFDISVLELLYTLSRGFTVVVYLDRDRADDDTTAGAFAERHPDQAMDFSLFYFSGDEAEGTGRDKYRLLLEGARFADQHDFRAVWTPERHFHAFGGLYPQPAVTGAAVAAITERVGIRAGSVVMPLHHPIRVAEAWSVVDNLSNGRVGISVASGWQPNDFVLMPENHARAKDAMFDGLEQVKQLWRGETVEFDGPLGTPVAVATLPRPVQPELPVWVTTAGNPDTYIQAGRIGANVLTHLLGQSVEQLAPKIEAYRAAREEAGFDPDAGIVTLMLHTFVGADEDAVREIVREPLKAYLGTSFSLLREYAWTFPAFQRPAGASPDDSITDDDFKGLADDELDAVLEFAFLRYYESSGLFGTPERCLEMVDRLKGIGVGEIACLIDFGVPTDRVLASLPQLDQVRQQSNRPGQAEARSAAATLDQSVAAQLERHAVTHVQCTPSMARMWSMQDDCQAALAGVEHVFIGGEAFPVALAKELADRSRSGRITNMYGPTETTIWSTTWGLEGELDSIPIGTPIANTQIYVLDQHRQPLPPGVFGELWIGGAGVVRGYHDRPELTAERFVPDPFAGGDARMYLTGDVARWRRRDDGTAILEFLGRADHQVKLRGYRIELGEIEAQLGQLPDILECVAVVREDTPGDQLLVAYVSTVGGTTVDPAHIKARLRDTLPDVMVPAHIAVLDRLPQTPNGKIDRNALPSIADVLGARATSGDRPSADSDLEREVLKVWEETLGTSGIGVNDNFFDIGGHSLLIVRMHRRLRDDLDPSIALTDLYRFPTIRTFAASRSGDQQTSTQTSLDRAARRRETMLRRRRR